MLNKLDNSDSISISKLKYRAWNIFDAARMNCKIYSKPQNNLGKNIENYILLGNEIGAATEVLDEMIADNHFTSEKAAHDLYKFLARYQDIIALDGFPLQRRRIERLKLDIKHIYSF